MPPNRPLAAALLSLAALGACSVPDRPTDVHDPYEPVNRRMHEATKAADTAVLRPAAMAYGTAVPRPLRRGITNLADTIDTPRYVVNDLLQGRIGDAGHNFVRFTMNVVFGLGLLDVASSAGVEPRPSDFGETLYRWGAPEGAYLSLPLLGPSTERDAAGSVVDIALNPVSVLASPKVQAARPGVAAATLLDGRYEQRGTIDQVLYDSVDSYAQTRSIYLQNRRYELSGGSDAEDDFAFDPYEDF